MVRPSISFLLSGVCMQEVSGSVLFYQSVDFDMPTDTDYTSGSNMTMR